MSDRRPSGFRVPKQKREDRVGADFLDLENTGQLSLQSIQELCVPLSKLLRPFGSHQLTL